MMRVVTVLVFTAALGALFVFGLQPRDARDVDSPFVGRVMDDFDAPVVERYRADYGDMLRFSEQQGKPVVVNFWASWCIPACWNEASRWKAAYERYGDEVLILGINFQDQEADMNEFLDRFDKPFPSVRDPQGVIGIDWGVFGVPETYFIRADGTLHFKKNGEISAEEIDEHMQALIEGA